MDISIDRSIIPSALTSSGSDNSNRSKRFAFHCWITDRSASRSSILFSFIAAACCIIIVHSTFTWKRFPFETDVVTALDPKQLPLLWPLLLLLLLCAWKLPRMFPPPPLPQQSLSNPSLLMVLLLLLLLAQLLWPLALDVRCLLPRERCCCCWWVFRRRWLL